MTVPKRPRRKQAVGMRAEQLLALLGRNLDDALLNDLQLLFGFVPTVTESKIPNQWYIDVPAAGWSCAVMRDNRIGTIFLFSGNEKPHSTFDGELPCDVTFERSRSEVRAALGTPTGSGEARMTPGLGLMPPWDRYDCGSFSLHLRYAHDERAILRVSVALPEAVPK